MKGYVVIKNHRHFLGCGKHDRFLYKLMPGFIQAYPPQLRNLGSYWTGDEELEPVTQVYLKERKWRSLRRVKNSWGPTRNRIYPNVPVAYRVKLLFHTKRTLQYNMVQHMQYAVWSVSWREGVENISINGIHTSFFCLLQYNWERWILQSTTQWQVYVVLPGWSFQS